MDHLLDEGPSDYEVVREFPEEDDAMTVRGRSSESVSAPGPGPQGCSGKVLSSLLRGLRAITVEPVLFMYMFAFMLTSVVEQAFYVDKACRVNLGFNDTVCSNMERPENKEFKEQVQVVVSSFHQYNGIASNAVPLFLALFLGAWSDRRGRKLTLLLGLAGQVYFFFMLTIVATQSTWPLEVVMGLATFPAALTGANLAVFAAAFSYVSDITSPSDRTLRIGILDGVYLASMPTGIALGSYLYVSVVNRSFTAMFAINTVLLGLTLVYSFCRLEWQTTESQRPLTGVNICSDFFDWKHISGSFRAVFKKRPNFGRLYLILIIISMGLYTFQRNERAMSYLYTQLRFHWDTVQFSNFRTFQTSVYVVLTLIGMPLMTKCFGFKDSVIILIGAPSHAIARVIFALAKVDTVFYIGAAVSSLGPTVAPVLRSMASKLVSMEERGKVFAILTMADSATPLISSIIYSQVYNATINTYPAAIFWVTVTSQALVFSIILFIHVSLKRKPRDSDAETFDRHERS